MHRVTHRAKPIKSTPNSPALWSPQLFLAHCFASPVCIYCTAASQRLSPTSSSKTVDSCSSQTSSDKPTISVLLHYLPSMKWQRASVNKCLAKSTIYSKTKSCESKLQLKPERLFDAPLSGDQKDSSTWMSSSY